MMGLLDGQKAVTAQESAAAQTGGSRSVGLTANNGQAEKVSASYDTGMLHAYGNWSSEVGDTPNPEESSGGVPLPGINNANSTVGREPVENIDLVPVADGLYVDTKTGEVVDGYNYEGNGEKPIFDTAAAGINQADFAIAQKLDEIVHGEDLGYKDKEILHNELRELENERANSINVVEKGITIEEENKLRAEEINTELQNLEIDYIEGNVDEAEYEERKAYLNSQKMQLPPPPQPPLNTTGDPNRINIFTTHPYDESISHAYAEYYVNDEGLSADANGLFDVASLYENGKKYVGKDSFTLSVMDAIANGKFPVGTNLLVQFALQYDGKEEWGDQVSQMGDEVQLPYKDNGNLDESSDCSSFVGNMYEMFFGKGFLEGSYTESQFNGLVEKEAYQPSLDELRPADLIYYKLSDRNPNATHVAMYLGKDEEGNDLIIHTYGDDSSDTRLHVETLGEYNDYVYTSNKGTLNRKRKPRGDLITGIFRVLSDEQYKSLIVDYPI